MKEMQSRREWIGAVTAAIAGVAAVNALMPRVANAELVPMRLEVFKDPSCGCCKSWVEHLTASGFKPIVHDRTDMDAFKDSVGVPAPMRSCHTAMFGGYWIEGHVPAADMKKLEATRPKGVVGLAVPGMPAGSPGMEVGKQKDAYDVMAVYAGGKTSVFAKHG